MTREHSNSVSRRKPDVGRRNSPASQTLDQARSALEAVDSNDSVKQLTERLNFLRQELEDMERQIMEEDQDFQMQKGHLVDKRDDKKAALKEKEDASKELRKEVATLERQSAAAQTRRAQQEKVLRQKEAERKKLKDDVTKWTREAGELALAAERIAEERVEYEATCERRIQDIKEKHVDETQANKTLEDAIRERGIQVKALEEERHTLEEGQEGGEVPDCADTDREEDNRWKMTLGLLQQQYAQAWTICTEAERTNVEVVARLNYLQHRRLSQPQLFSSPPVPEMGPPRRNSQRTRPLSMREGLLSQGTGGFVHTSTAPFNSIPTTSSPSFANITPYFNPVNGMALPPRHSHTSSFSQADFEGLTGGAPMSPTAGSLLPAGLFGDDLGLTDAEDDEDDPGPPQAPSLDPSPNLRNVLPGLGAPGHVDRSQNPSSPVSPQSRSPFASPRESAGELQHYANNDPMDSDRRSIRSTTSSFQNLPLGQASRFGGIFGLHRQRGKTISDDGPALGSLKPAQSQSLPRQDHGPDGAGSSRRRGSHSEGAWYDSFIRTKTMPVEPSSSPNHVSTRKRPFNMFGTKADPWLTSVLGFEKPPSPRQGSTKSGEGMTLPRPSTESQTRFGWSVDAFGARSSPLGVDWSVKNNNTTSWSRMPSRRPSVQYGSTTNLMHEDSMHDDLLDFPSNTKSPTQAPIGTRPQSSASHMPGLGQLPPFPPTPPRLNPTAASFSIPALGKKTDEDKAEKAKRLAEKAAEKEAKKAEKAEKKEEKEKRAKAERAEKAARKGKEKQVASDASIHSESRDPTSPHDSRMSRDTYSIISTADVSEASPRESLERSISHTPSEHTGSIGKESFMQKLTRKGSTNQFLTFGMNSTLFSKVKTTDAPATPDETNEEGGFLGVHNTNSATNSPSIGTPKDKTSALSWSSLKKLGKKDKAPSLHESVAGSEVTGDEDDHWGHAKA
jgi:hypothetical protein